MTIRNRKSSSDSDERTGLSPLQLTMVVTAALVGLLSAYLTHIPLVAGFSVGFATLWLVAERLGIPQKVLLRSAWVGLGHTKEVIWILLLVGLLIPAWMAAGTIPYLIDTGLKLMQPASFLTGSFLLSMVISMVLGTSTGTLSSIGIPLMGVAAVLQVPLPMAAGALISGAFVGDRSSPFSSAHRLVASSTGITIRRLSWATLPTTLGAIAISALLFGGLDLTGSWRETAVSDLTSGYASSFHYHPILALPPILLLAGILLRLRTRNAFLVSIAAAVGIGSWLQGTELTQWPVYLWNGFDSANLPNLHGKGIADMLDLVLLIAMAGAFNGILEEQGLIRAYAERIVGGTGQMTAATLRTALFGFGLGLISCTQTLPIMMTGRNLLRSWTSRFPEEQLARVTSDTSLIFAAMIPWNMLAVLCSTILDVQVESYVPYAAFLWSLPLLTFMVSWLHGIKKKRPLNG